MMEPELVQMKEMVLWANPSDQIITPFLKSERTWEPVETELLRKLIKPGDVVLDVGANIGYYAVLFGRWVGDGGWVIAVEPEPDNFSLLCRNLAANGSSNVIPLPVAASDRFGELALYLSSDNKGDHRAYDSHPSSALGGESS
jgi:tRNA G37 N-methylase Trm5